MAQKRLYFAFFLPDEGEIAGNEQKGKMRANTANRAYYQTGGKENES